MKLKILFFLFFCFQSFTLYGTAIRVIDLQYIIDNNTAILNLIKEIDNDQKSHRKNFKENEIALNLELERIEELKLILSNTELEKEINKYNDQLNQFNAKIERFNFHYENQVNILKNILLEKTLKILKKYSLDNKIDLILGSNDYILSNDSLNITNVILEKLNNININIKFEKFK